MTEPRGHVPISSTSTTSVGRKVWEAEIMLSRDEDGTFHLYGRVTSASTKDDALAGAQYLYDVLGRGKDCFLRAPPEVWSGVDFETGKEKHRGAVRFSYRDEVGVTRLGEQLHGQMQYFGVKGSDNP